MQKPHIRVMVATACALITGGVGVLVLVGWQTHNPRLMCIVPGYITMKANTAVAFVTSAIALYLALGRHRKWAGWVALGPGILGGLSLLEYLTGRLNIDEILFKDPYSAVLPGRMAHITAVNLVIASVSLVLLSRKKSDAAQIAFGLLGSVSMFAVLGYAYGVPLLYGSTHYTAMALHTGAGFLILALGGLAASSDGGMLAILWVDGASAHLVRRLLPAAVLIPVFVGFVILRNPVSQMDARLAAALIVLLDIVLFAAMVLRSALIVYRLEMEKESAEFLSQVDALTQVLNRRGLDRALEQEFTRRQRFKSPFSVMMIDIDLFKSINDEHGHLMGDSVLQRLSGEWKKQIRSVDVLGRYGGEEFLLLAPGTGCDGARTLADKIRETSLALSIVEFGFSVSVSCGVATAGIHGETGKELVEAADLAVYRAKAEGRNRTVVATATSRANPSL